MRLLLQRVERAQVRFPGVDRPARGIGKGLVIFVGVGAGDDAAAARRMAEKAAALRIFSNAAGKFDFSLVDTKGAALVVSQFTLYGDCARGRRPDFTGAMAPAEAEALYRNFVADLASLGIEVQTGEFGAKMEVELVNDGPVTLWLDSAAS
jgi:D-aminoacyl-tRNA deacylase